MKIENKVRIYRMGFLTGLYDCHTQRLLNEESLRYPSDYASNEISANLINNLFGTSVTPTELYRDDSETANKCIQLKESFDELLENVTDLGILTEQVVLSAIKHIETKPEFIMLRLMHAVWAPFMGQVMYFASEAISEKDFMKVLEHYRDKKFPLNFDLKTMIRCMQKMEGVLGVLSAKEQISLFERKRSEFESYSDHSVTK